MRVRQEPDVEHQVGVHRNAVLVAEAHEIDGQVGFLIAADPREGRERLAELMDRQIGGVDNLVGHRADAVHLAPFGANAFGRRPAGRHWMRPTRFAEAPQQGLVGRFQKNQRGIQSFHRPKLSERLLEIGQEIFFADVHDDGDARDAFAAHQIRERWNQRRAVLLRERDEFVVDRKIFDAVDQHLRAGAQRYLRLGQRITRLREKGIIAGID